MKIASFFSGCGGLDLGFEQAGFDIIWANEYDKSIFQTYESNHPSTYLCKSDIRQINPNDIPVVDGFIGGPPCQSWSYGGAHRGLADDRGKLFVTYIEIIKKKQPKFFIIENVDGMLSDVHYPTFITFVRDLENCGYNVYYQLLNAVDYNIPQERKRVFIVGFRSDLNCRFKFPNPSDSPQIPLIRAIGDIVVPPTLSDGFANPFAVNGRFYNHDCYTGPYDKKFMARNRVRAWDEVSFTIQAQAKNCPLHPQAPKMEFLDANTRKFKSGYEHLYRRLSVRECARIQTFPDSFRFYYQNVKDGYKMVGNAVPPRLAYRLAMAIKNALSQIEIPNYSILVGYYKDEQHLSAIIRNNLYYVRTGFNRGAFSLQPNSTQIKYLILHRRDQIQYFELCSNPPEIFSSKELEQLGFTPKHNLYLVFKIKSKLDKPLWASNIAQSLNGRSKTRPFLIEMPDNANISTNT